MTSEQKSDLLLVRKDMDVNEHERLYNFTLRHKLKSDNTFITVLHFTVTVRSSKIKIAHYTL
jgi:hypothetical protein